MVQSGTWISQHARIRFAATFHGQAQRPGRVSAHLLRRNVHASYGLECRSCPVQEFRSGFMPPGERTREALYETITALDRPRVDAAQATANRAGQHLGG